MANHVIYFEYRRRGPDDAFEIIPAIDGTALTTLIDRFELAAGMHPAGGAYGGLVPSYFRYGSMDELFHGTTDLGLGADTPLLACECGEVGCWPLMARITLTGDFVI